MDQASLCTRKQGEIAVVVAITRPILYESFTLAHREQRMYGVWTYESEDFKKAYEMINHGLDISSFITQVLPLEETQRGLEMLGEKKEPVLKILIEIAPYKK